MPHSQVIRFLRQLAHLSLADWRIAADRWSKLEPTSFDRADRSALFAMQQHELGDDALDLEHEIGRVVNSMRFFAREGASVRHSELEAMRGAALTAGFGFLARSEIDDDEFRLLTSPFDGLLRTDG